MKNKKCLECEQLIGAKSNRCHSCAGKINQKKRKRKG